ncbi:putative diguanylate cyclase DgcQ [compost metagenome]
MHNRPRPGSRLRALSLLASAHPRRTVYLCFAVVFVVTLVLAGRKYWRGQERQLSDRQHHLQLLAYTIDAAVGARHDQLRFLTLSAEHVLATAKGEPHGADIDLALHDALQASHDAVWGLRVPDTDAIVRSISDQRLGAIEGYRRDPVTLVEDLQLARVVSPLLSAQQQIRKGLAHVMLVTRSGLIVAYPAVDDRSVEPLLREFSGSRVLNSGAGSTSKVQITGSLERLKPGSGPHLLYTMPILSGGAVRGVFVLGGPQQRLQDYLHEQGRAGEPVVLLDTQGTIIASNEKTFTPGQGNWFGTLPTQMPGLSMNELLKHKAGSVQDAGNYYLYRELPGAQLMLIHHVTAQALRWGVISQFSTMFIGIWISLGLLLVMTLFIVDHLLMGQLSLNAQLRELGLVDVLTQLANRRRLQMDFKGLVRRFQGQQPIALLMIDIDKFKHINDNWGHSAGDEVLKHLAALCREQVRPQDLVARYGGEEFCVLLPATSLAQATAMAEQLRESIARSVCVPQASTLLATAPSPHIRLTVSIGVAEANADQAGNLEELVAKADRRLYAAKQNGRNRVVADDTLIQLQVPPRA